MTAVASDLPAAADSIASQFGIPSSIFRSLIQNESGWDDTAASPTSSAFGLTQLTAGTASDMGVTDITDPMQQLLGGARYLAQQYSTFGNWTDALAAYNQGPGGVNNPAGQQYAQKILGPTQHDPAASTSTGVFSGLTDWITSKMGNVGLVFLGAGILLVALVMTPAVRNTATKAVKAAK